MEVKKVVRMEQYRQKSNNRPKKRLKKKFKGFFFSLFIILIVGSVFYFTSSISKLSMVYFEGLNYVSRSGVRAYRASATLPKTISTILNPANSATLIKL